MISHKSSPCSSLFTSLQARTELEHRNALRLVCVNDAVNGIALRDVDQNSKKTVQETKNGSFTPRNAAWPWSAARSCRREDPCSTITLYVVLFWEIACIEFAVMEVQLRTSSLITIAH